MTTPRKSPKTASESGKLGRLKSGWNRGPNASGNYAKLSHLRYLKAGKAKGK